MMRLPWLACSLLLLGMPLASAAVQTRPVAYRHQGAVLEGYLAYDDSVSGLRPGVLVVHEWKGLGSYTKRRAEQLAQLGYVAFAVDLYGKGIYAQDHEQAASLSGIYRKDRGLLRGRMLAALDILLQTGLVDSDRVAAIGYCFGGMAALELARSGADIAGVVTFHGALDTPHPEDAQHITGKVLVLHGADDRFVTQDQVNAFEDEMNAAGVSYRVIQYPGAVHSFTVPDAGHDPSTGLAYNEEADKRSWEEMKTFLEGLFRGSELRTVG